LPRCCCGLLQVKRRLFACRWFRAAAPLPFGTLCAVVTQRPRPTPKGTSCRVAVLLLQPLKQLGCASGSSHVRRRCFPSLGSAGILVAFISGEASCITRLSRRTPNGVRALHALHSLGAAHIYVRRQYWLALRMKLLKLLATVVCLVMAALGVVGVMAPNLLLELAHILLLPPAIYWVAVIRVAFGVLLFLVAPASRLPRTLRVVGAVIVAAGLVTPLLPTSALEHAVTWFTGQGTNLFRIFAVAPIVIGALLAYAVNPSRARFSDNAV
jgi:hypothetical protein